MATWTSNQVYLHQITTRVKVRSKSETLKFMIIMLQLQQIHLYKYAQSHIIILHRHVSLASVTTIIRLSYKENKIYTKQKCKNIWQNH